MRPEDEPSGVPPRCRREITVEEAKRRLSWHLRTYHGMTLEDVKITDTRGYWRCRQACGGRGECASPLHNAIGCDDGVQHTIPFVEDLRDEQGRFISPFLVWDILHAHERGDGHVDT